MPSEPLTERLVERLRPESQKLVRKFDRRYPLVLTVSYGGTKSWFAVYYVKGKMNFGKLGQHPAMSLKEAREASRKYEPPLSRFKPKTYREVAEDFLKRHVEANELLSRHEIARMLKKYVFPVWGDRPFVEIKRRDVSDLLDAIQDEVAKRKKSKTGRMYDGKRQADVVLAILRKLANWYQARDDDYVSPIVKGMNRSTAGARRRKRILSHEEIRVIWEEAGKFERFGALLKLLLLTAQRKEKAVTMRWTDTTVGGVWTIPSVAREKGHMGRARLPRVAVDLIEQQAPINANPFVFPAAIGRLQFNSFSQRKRELDARVRKRLPAIERWTIHDLRRTARSLMSEAGVESDHAERVMGHAIAGVEGVYDLYTYEREKSAALEKLAALLMKIVGPQRVPRARPVSRELAAAGVNR